MAFDLGALSGIKKEAEGLGVEWEALAAVAEVESDGRPLWDGLCPIRIEGHYFDKRLSPEQRKSAREQGLSNPFAGKVKNPEGMRERYIILDQMIALDEAAALESCSWGLGQVMGAHWKTLGYSSVKELVSDAKESVAGQISLMVRFINHSGLKKALKSKDWASFARAYNGKNYVKYKYDTKMAAAYERFKAGSSGDAEEQAADILERGSAGSAVEALQVSLRDFGFYRGRIDGDFGGGTEAGVMDFQRAVAIQVDGRAGPQTMLAVSNWEPGSAKSPVTADVVYKNQHATRNRPVTGHLEITLAAAVTTVYGPGFRAEIYSGGQPRKGMPGKRTGSIRHDDYGQGGRALDAWIVNKSGKRLSGAELGRLGQYWLAQGYGGCGLEMAGGGIHLDEWTTPPPGGGMFWTYPYLDGQTWGSQVRAMLVAGAGGKVPRLHGDK